MSRIENALSFHNKDLAAVLPDLLIFCLEELTLTNSSVTFSQKPSLGFQIELVAL